MESFPNLHRKFTGKFTGNFLKVYRKVYRKTEICTPLDDLAKNIPKTSLPESFTLVPKFPLAPLTGVIFWALEASPGAAPEAFFHVEEPRPEAFSGLWGLPRSARSLKTSAENSRLGWRVASCNLQQRSNLLFGSVLGSNAGTGQKWSGALGSGTAWHHSSGTR